MHISLTKNTNLIINEELKRIHEIMGLKSLILLESGGPVRLFSELSTEVAESVINRLKRAINDAGANSDIFIAGQKFEKDDVLRAIRAMESDLPGEAYNATTSNTQKIINIILSENTDASNLAYNELIQHLRTVRGTIGTEEELLKKIQQKLKSNPQNEPQEIFNSQFTSEWNNLLEIAGPAFERQYSDYIHPSGSKFRPISTTVGGQSKGGTVLTDDQLSSMRKALRKKSPRKFNVDYFKVFTRSVEASKAEIRELANGYYTKITEKEYTPAQIKEISEEYAVAITRALNILEARENNAAQTALKNSGVDKSIINIIEEDPSEFFKIYRKIWGERQASNFRKEIVETTKNFWEDLNAIFRTADYEGKAKYIKKFFSLFNPKEKFGQFLLTDSFAVYDRQWQQMIKQSGWQKGNKAQYIASMMYLNSIGYILGSAFADIITILGDISIFNWLNKFLPLDIGPTGEEPWYTFERFDNDDSMAALNQLDGNPLALVALFFSKQLGSFADLFDNGILGATAKILVTIIKRTIPFGILTTTDSIDAKILEWILPIDFDGGADKIIEKIQNGLKSMFGNVLPEAPVVADRTIYEDNKSDFKKWFEAVHPDMVDDVRTYRRVDRDESDIYYLVNMKGTQATDYYYKYDENNKTFKDYE